MHHLHFETLPSTQNYLRENLPELLKCSKDILITTDHQTAGIGRRDHQWDHFEESLAFSFTLAPHEIPSLTSLEIAVLLQLYFAEHQQITLSLKWPNDLIHLNGKKVGGIIAHLSSGVLIVGVGINHTGSWEKRNLNYTATGIPFEKTSRIEINIYEFLLKNRLTTKEIQSKWANVCSHLHKKVEIIDGEEKTSGLFIGIGDHGEALLDINGNIEKRYSGSLFLVD